VVAVDVVNYTTQMCRVKRCYNFVDKDAWFFKNESELLDSDKRKKPPPETNPVEAS